MRIHRGILILLLMTMTIIGSCGDKKGSRQISLSKLLPEKFLESDMMRASDIRSYVGSELWEYIDGSAELYHQYNFSEAATADYKKGNIELVVDIYRFASADDAYGLYSMLRSPGTQLLNLGVEGFFAPASLNFVKGEYLVRITGYEQNKEIDAVIIGVAEEINKMLPGITSKPRAFSHFPANDRIPGTDQYYAESFLGQKFLTQVYSQDYRIFGDSLTLFLSPDLKGEKYLQWSEMSDKISKKFPAPELLPFDNKYAFIYSDNLLGLVITGLKTGRLVGMTNYTASQDSLLADWLNSLQ